MKTDEALLEEVLRSGNAFLRLYRWDPATLSIGRNQPAVFEGVPVVRRPTGGSAVWHDDEVTYAVAAPIAIFGSLRRAYCEIHARLARALRALGVETTLAPAHPPVRPSAHAASCFAQAVGGEVLVDGRKVVGSAQVRRGAAFLQHGSILLSGSQAILGTSALQTTLAAALGRAITFEEVTAAIVAHWPEPLSPSARQPVSPSLIASVASG
ncbi:MAG TPA: hypothetical protein VN803_06680 [Gemmatimonadales bacterium]|nr:hypothetical protein [Gemmatimonadales bacterium]